ncbi:MAG TPA: homocysteine S-methyltransferase family protein [Candidatus Saccharimonadales bacterium]|nr:homocysteine S-methyltransferase family protein [Candidatus Saccharimonadales bacterium]
MSHIKHGLVERLQEGTVLGAEGYLFELERRGYVKAGAYVPEVVLDHPDALRQLHREFLRAGSEVLVAFTYYAHRDKLRIIDREKDLEQLNRQAVRIAKEIAEGNDVLVAGNICNTWVYDPANKKHTSAIVRQMYDEQVRWAAEEGADFIIAETIGYIGEALIALGVIKKYQLPALVTFGAAYPKSKDGYDWVEGCRLLEANGADVVGFNCIRGPKTMLPLLRRLRKTVSCPIAAQPVPYHTTSRHPNFHVLKYKGVNAFPLSLDSFLCTRGEMAEFAMEAKDIGVNYIGICCGGAPHHVRAMAEALGRTVPASRYSPDMSKHGLLGSDKVVKRHERQFLAAWK